MRILDPVPRSRCQHAGIDDVAPAEPAWISEEALLPLPVHEPAAHHLLLLRRHVVDVSELFPKRVRRFAPDEVRRPGPGQPQEARDIQDAGRQHEIEDVVEGHAHELRVPLQDPALDEIVAPQGRRDLGRWRVTVELHVLDRLLHNLLLEGQGELLLHAHGQRDLQEALRHTCRLGADPERRAIRGPQRQRRPLQLLRTRRGGREAASP
mmetsp:Transcript_80807/g.174673  ORF Transcript_80807/g.174673 Transcript_80807/m.174673 type:complete len:209 (-) Transcript_80807:172-798(-)